jgi:hypothetical protein
MHLEALLSPAEASCTKAINGAANLSFALPPQPLVTSPGYFFSTANNGATGLSFGAPLQPLKALPVYFCRIAGRAS